MSISQEYIYLNNQHKGHRRKNIIHLNQDFFNKLFETYDAELSHTQCDNNLTLKCNEIARRHLGNTKKPITKKKIIQLLKENGFNAINTYKLQKGRVIYHLPNKERIEKHDFENAMGAVIKSYFYETLDKTKSDEDKRAYSQRFHRGTFQPLA